MLRRDHARIQAAIACVAALAVAACASGPAAHGTGGASPASSSSAVGTGGASPASSSSAVGTGGAGGGGPSTSSGGSTSASSTGSTGGGAADGGSSATILTFQKFDAPALPSDWSIGAQSGGAVSISTDTTANYGGSAGSLRGSFPASQGGGVFVWAAYDMSAHQSRDVGIRLRARMPGSKQGLKFVKVFGGNASGAYANTTFGLDYTGIDPGCMPAPSVRTPQAMADAGATVIAEVLAERLPLTLARVKVVEVFEQLYIEQVLADHGGNVVRAAAASGVARRYFQILRNRRRR